MNRWTWMCRASVATGMALAIASTAAAGGDCFYCYRKPLPSGPNNNCFGYYPTIWRAWPGECQPVPASYPVPARVPEKVTTPPTPPPPATPVKPASLGVKMPVAPAPQPMTAGRLQPIRASSVYP